MTKPNLTIVIHGESGAGKTYLANTAPGPRLFIDAEGGSQFISGHRVVWDAREPLPKITDPNTSVVVSIKKYTDLANVYGTLAAGKHPFNSVILDSLTEIQKRCLDSISGVEAPERAAWGELLRKMEGLVRSFRDLTMANGSPGLGMVVFIVGSKMQDGLIRPLLQGQVGLTLPFFVDVVGHLQIAQNDDGDIVRKMLVAPLGGVVAKDRTGRFGVVIENPNLSSMLGHLRGES